MNRVHDEARAADQHDASTDDAARAREVEGEAGESSASVTQSTGEPGTTATLTHAPASRPNIRLKRTGTVEITLETTHKEPKPGGEDGEEIDVPDKHLDPVYADALAPGPLSIGMSEPIIMPPKDEQREGWFEPRAREIISSFPDRYIAVVEKGV